MIPFGMYIPHNFTFVPLKFYKKYGLYKNLSLSMDYHWVLRNYKNIKNNILKNVI